MRAGGGGGVPAEPDARVHELTRRPRGDDAGEHVERYSYQFYVAPDNVALGALIRELPRERRTMWQNKNKVTT